MAAIDYEAEYNNRRRVPEFPTIRARWLEASKRVRAQLGTELDVPYGTRERQRYDLFAPAHSSSDTPLIVYIHGGYWQRADRTEYSFVAENFVAAGAAIAIPSYTLCPAGTVADIADEMRLFMRVLWQKRGKRPVVVGHSAGGHLAATLLATDWQKQGGVPTELVKAAYSISGVFNLSPLIETSLNEALRLDEPTARAASPLFGPAPPRGSTFVGAVGSNESSEFIRQSREMARVWSTAGVAAECVVVPNADHFTIVDEFCRPDGPMLARIMKLART